MLSLEELRQIRDSLNECYPSAEDHGWGPSYELIQQRRAEALALVKDEINYLVHKNETK